MGGEVLRVEINPGGARNVFLSEELRDLLKSEADGMAPEMDSHIKSHMRGPLNMQPVAVRTKMLKNTWIAILQARSFRRGAKHGFPGPSAAARKHGMR